MKFVVSVAMVTTPLASICQWFHITFLVGKPAPRSQMFEDPEKVAHKSSTSETHLDGVRVSVGHH